MVRVNNVYRICYQNNIMANNCQCHLHFPFVPDSLLIEHLKLSQASDWGLLEPYRLGGVAHCASPLFLLYLWSSYNQTWHDGTLGQNLSKAIKVLLTSSLGGMYDVIKLLLVSF